MEALQVLGLPSAEQIRVTEPGCVTCELYDDFVFNHELFVEAFANELSDSQKEKLAYVLKKLEAIPDEGFVCFDMTALNQPGWDTVRVAASEALREMHWPEKAPEPYKETKDGVWQRPPPHEYEDS